MKVNDQEKLMKGQHQETPEVIERMYKTTAGIRWKLKSYTFLGDSTIFVCTQPTPCEFQPDTEPANQASEILEPSIYLMQKTPFPSFRDIRYGC